MKQNNSRLVVSLVGNVLKASLILLIVSAGLMIYALADSDVSGNYHNLSPGSTMVTSPVFRHSGDQLQLFVSLGDEANDNLNDQTEIMKLLVVFERSLTYDFTEATSIFSGIVNDLVRDIVVTEDGYYRIKVTNISDQSVDFLTGSAGANLGVVIVLVIALILLAIALSTFAVTLSLSITAIVFFVMFYPIYLLIKNEQRPKVYYSVPPQVATTNMQNQQEQS